MAMEVFSPVSLVYPFSRRGGIASTEAVRMDAETDTRRLKRQASPLLLALVLRGTKANVQTDFATISTQAGHTAFKFKDPWDHEVTLETVGTGNASRTVFYLDRKYIDSSSLTVYLDSVETSAYTLSGEEGKVTFDSPPGSGVTITADYEFYGKFFFEIIDPGRDLEIKKIGPNVWELGVKLKESLV